MQPLSPWQEAAEIATHVTSAVVRGDERGLGDVRVNVFFDRVGAWGLPLRRGSLAFSVGPEFKLAWNTSLSLQIDGSQTPYVPTGTVAFDTSYGGAVTLGFSQRFGRHLLSVYARENMTLPFRIRMTTDPDLSVGIKATIR